MTVTLYSLTPPTRNTSTYLLRPTLLNGPRSKPLPRRHIVSAGCWCHPVVENGVVQHRDPDGILDDIDDWYSPQIEDDGFLERLDRSAEIVRFP